MILYNFANGRALRVECETSKMEVCENLTFKFVLQFEIFLVKLFSFLGFLGLACFEYVRLLGARKQAPVTLAGDKKIFKYALLCKRKIELYTF